MSDKKITEDEFLQQRVMDQRPIFCFLSSGCRIQGTIRAADLHVIFIRPPEAEDDAGLMMVFKQQISSIVPISAPYVVRNPAREVSCVLRGKTTGRS